MTTTQPEAEQQEETKQWRFRSLNKMDYIILIILCVSAIGIAGYDLYNLGETRDTCLNKCNEHWVAEFRSKCAGPWQEEEQLRLLVYNLPINRT